MSNYIIQGETLTGIADAIREKTGGTDQLSPSAMASAIAGIQAGGGIQMATGSVTFAEDTAVRGTNIEHNAGFVPQILIIMAEEHIYTTYAFEAGCYMKLGVLQTSASPGFFVRTYNNAYDAPGKIMTLQYKSFLDTWNETVFQAEHSITGTVDYKAGTTYHWLVIGGL